jgi:hypothetical protein
VSREASWLPGSDWHLASLALTDITRCQRYTWACNQWLDRKAGLTKIWDAAAAAAGQSQDLALLSGPLATPPGCTTTSSGQKQQQQQQQQQQYKLTVVTSDKMGAGTSAKVGLQLGDVAGATWQPQLAQKTSHFERGSKDFFLLTHTVDGPGLTALRSARVWLQGGGAGAFWHLAELQLTDLQTLAAWRFVANEWVSSGMGPQDGLLLAAEALPAGMSPSRRTSQVAVAAGQQLARLSIGEVPEQFLHRGRSSLGRTASVVVGLPLDHELVVATGDKLGAGTDATVHVEVLGPGGAVLLAQALPQGRELFERRCVDRFSVVLPEGALVEGFRLWSEGSRWVVVG